MYFYVGQSLLECTKQTFLIIKEKIQINWYIWNQFSFKSNLLFHLHFLINKYCF